MTRRRSLTAKEKHALLEKQENKCALCGLSLLIEHKVEYDHTIPVALGNTEKPDRAVHQYCHWRKTKGDRKNIAKAYRLHRSWFGDKKPARKKMQSRPFDKRWRKRMDGTVVPRSAV